MGDSYYFLDQISNVYGGIGICNRGRAIGNQQGNKYSQVRMSDSYYFLSQISNVFADVGSFFRVVDRFNAAIDRKPGYRSCQGNYQGNKDRLGPDLVRTEI